MRYPKAEHENGSTATAKSAGGAKSKTKQRGGDILHKASGGSDARRQSYVFSGKIKQSFVRSEAGTSHPQKIS